MKTIDFGFAATIPNGVALSNALNMNGYVLCGVLIPATFTGVTLTFQASDTLTGTYVDITDGTATIYSVAVAGARFVPVDATLFLGVKFIKIKSGANEAAQRVVLLSGRMF